MPNFKKWLIPLLATAVLGATATAQQRPAPPQPAPPSRPTPAPTPGPRSAPPSTPSSRSGPPPSPSPQPQVPPLPLQRYDIYVDGQVVSSNVLHPQLAPVRVATAGTHSVVVARSGWAVDAPGAVIWSRTVTTTQPNQSIPISLTRSLRLRPTRPNTSVRLRVRGATARSSDVRQDGEHSHPAPALAKYPARPSPSSEGGASRRAGAVPPELLPFSYNRFLHWRPCASCSSKTTSACGG